MKKPEEKFFEDNYPDGYIEHYLAMYSIHQEGWSNEDFETQNGMYIAFEGKEEFQNLKNEVIKAKQQADLDRFLKLPIVKDIKGINLDNLARMFEAIETFKT